MSIYKIILTILIVFLVSIGIFFTDGANAIISNNTKPVYGRKVSINTSPVIWDGIGTNTVKVSRLSDIMDLDNDKLIDWEYVWFMDGVRVTTPSNAGNISAIPEYRPPANSIGKKFNYN